MSLMEIEFNLTVGYLFFFFNKAITIVLKERMKNGKAIAKVCHYPLIFKNKRQGKKRSFIMKEVLILYFSKESKGQNLWIKLKHRNLYLGL